MPRTSRFFPEETRMLDTKEKHVLKMTNIPWEISIRDVLEFFEDYSIDVDGVHIPIDRSTGKTKNEIYVEFDDWTDMVQALARNHRRTIKAREIFLNRSSFEELFHAHFPGTSLDGSDEYLSPAEIQSISTICRHYKVHFSRKCAERPFEHVVSIVRLLPWTRMDVGARMRCFDLLKSAIEALLVHQSKPNTTIDVSLLARMVACAKKYAVLDPRQRKYLEMTEHDARPERLDRVPRVEMFEVFGREQWVS